MKLKYTELKPRMIVIAEYTPEGSKELSAFRVQLVDINGERILAQEVKSGVVYRLPVQTTEFFECPDIVVEAKRELKPLISIEEILSDQIKKRQF